MTEKTPAFETVEVLSNGGRLTYAVDNTGNTDISAELQSIFDDVAKIDQASATITFAPGMYYINAP